MTRIEKAEQLRALAQERILVKDGPYGSMIQTYKLDEAGFRSGRDFTHDQKGNNDLLNLTRPDVVGAICKDYIAAGAEALLVEPVALDHRSIGAVLHEDPFLRKRAQELGLLGAGHGRTPSRWQIAKVRSARLRV